MSPSSKGFTLIELLIVLVLIGLSSSIILPSMWQQYAQTKYRAELAKVKTLANFCRHYSYYKGQDLQIELKDNSFIITTNADGKLLRRLDFETLTFENKTLIFDKKSTFNKTVLMINIDNKAEVREIEI